MARSLTEKQTDASFGAIALAGGIFMIGQTNQAVIIAGCLSAICGAALLSMSR